MMSELTAFSEDGISFTTDDELVTGFYAPGGGGATSSDYYLESDSLNTPHALGSIGNITVTEI